MLQYLKLFLIFAATAFLFSCSAPPANNTSSTVTESQGSSDSNLPEGWDDIENVIGDAKEYSVGKTVDNKAMFYLLKQENFPNWAWKVQTIRLSGGALNLTLYAISSSGNQVVNQTWTAKFYPWNQSAGRPLAMDKDGYDLTLKILSTKEGEVTFKPMPQNTSGEDFGTFKVYNQ